MKKYISRFMSGVLLSFALVSSLTYAGDEGYIDLDLGGLSKKYGEPKVEVNLDGTMLGLISQFSEGGDPELPELLSSLDSVRVRIFNLNNQIQGAFEVVDDVTKTIRKKGWKPLVTVNEQHERVRIFAKYTEKKMDGLVVMVVDSASISEEQGSGEFVFINIVGEIDPSNVKKVTESLQGIIK